MAQPNAYTPVATFADDERTNVGGRSTVLTADLDAEFAAVKTTTDGIRTNLSLNQRDDGEIRDGRVKLHTLAPEVLAYLLAIGGTFRGAWVTLTAYAYKDVVAQSGNTYVSTVAHTAGTFATDIAAFKWVLLAQGATAAAAIGFTPTATLAATDVQAAIAEADSENRTLSATASAAVVSLAADIANAAGATKGAGQVGLGNQVYPAGTVGWALIRGEVYAQRRGAVGDGTVDDTAVLQACIDTLKWVVIENPSAYYKTTAELNCGYSARLIGESGVRTVIRRSGGAGRVLAFAATNENSLIENLRIGGAGFTGIGLVGGGYANYVSTLALRNVSFERDLATCIDANLIYAAFTDSTFGYFVESAAHASHKHIKSSFSGGNFTNLNGVERCKFFYGAAAQASIDLNAGSIWTFKNCDWTACGRILLAANISGLLLQDCYTEQCVHATSLFDLTSARTRAKFVGGFYGASSGGTPTPTLIRYSDDTPLLLEDMDIVMGAAAYVLTNTTGSTHTIPSHGRVKVVDVRVQGNASDPLIGSDLQWSRNLSPKFWFIFDMSGAGTLVAASDPGINKGTDNGVGDWNINLPHPAAAAATALCVQVTGQASDCRGSGIVSGSNVRLQAYDQANPPVAKDDIVNVVVWGK